MNLAWDDDEEEEDIKTFKSKDNFFNWDSETRPTTFPKEQLCYSAPESKTERLRSNEPMSDSQSLPYTQRSSNTTSFSGSKSLKSSRQGTSPSRIRSPESSLLNPNATIERPKTKAAQELAGANTRIRKSVTKFTQLSTNPEETVRNLILQSDSDYQNEAPPVCLEVFRSLSSKRRLLNAAVGTHDGNILLNVLRYLKSTLDSSLFASLIKKHPDVVKLYVTYLKQLDCTVEAGQLISILEESCQPKVNTDVDKELAEATGKLVLELKNKVALENFSAIMHSNTANKRKEELNEFSKTAIRTSPFLAEYARKSALLLEFQGKLEKQEAIEAKTSPFMYSEFPLTDSVVGQTLARTIKQCSVYHLTKDPYVCPQCGKRETGIHLNAACMKKGFNIPDKVFQIAVIRGLTQTRSYTEIDKVVAPKGFAGFFSGGSKKFKPAVAPDRVIDVIMYVLEAYGRKGLSPPSSIKFFMELIDDQDTLDSVAREYNLFDLLIELYFQRRDKQNLMRLQTVIPRDTPEHQHLEFKLRDGSVKWKH